MSHTEPSPVRRSDLRCPMGLAIPTDRMIPGRNYRMSYIRGGQTSTVEGRFVGREVTGHGDDVVLALESNRLYIPISTTSSSRPLSLSLMIIGGSPQSPATDRTEKKTPRRLRRIQTTVTEGDRGRSGVWRVPIKAPMRLAPLHLDRSPIPSQIRRPDVSYFEGIVDGLELEPLGSVRRALDVEGRLRRASLGRLRPGRSTPGARRGGRQPSRL